MTPRPGSPDELAARVLAILARDTGRTDTDLTAMLGVTTAGLSPVIARLYRQGRADRCGPYLVAVPPAPGKSGTSGTCGTRPGHRAHAGFPWPGQVPEPPEPPTAPLPLPAAGSPGQGDEATPADTPQETAMTDTSPLAGAALWCAARGWPVFPIRPRAKKPPAVTGWENRATTDPARITACWAHGPYNIGIATGPANLVVLDLDKPKPGQPPPPEWADPGITDGADVLAALCERHGQPWPGATLTVRTGRGGLHLYFTAPPGLALANTAGATGRGLGWLIDTRARGGYIVAPGSIVDTPAGPARYQVACDQAPAPLPGWLAALLTPPRPEHPPLEGCSSVPGQVTDLDTYTATALKAEGERVRAAVPGGRNHALNKAAYKLGRLIATGTLPEDLAAAELHEAASAHFTADPPLTPAEATATIRAGIAAGKRRPRQLAAPGAAA